MSVPYYQDADVTLWHGDMRDILPTLGGTYDCAVVDPPYGETSLAWDRWPDGWPTLVAAVTKSMWCFGSMRMFLDRRDEFKAWNLSQDVVWQKPRSRVSSAEHFARNHEHATHWYHGPWHSVYHDAQRTAHHGKRVHVPVPPKAPAAAAESVRPIKSPPGYQDDGTRLMTTVIAGSAGDPRRMLHPTQKPAEILDPLTRYACPPGGTVLDCFAGSGSTADAARASGRRSVLIEAHEPYCETIARRLAQGDLFGGAA